MRSPTQRTLTPDEVDRYARAALGTGVRDCSELTGGGFAAVWRLELTDGRRVVLKVGPAAETPLLRYETGLIAAEAGYFRLVAERAPGVPVPAVLHHEDDRLVTAELPGTPLAAGSFAGARAGAGVRRQLGATVARLHAVTGDRFGYPGGRAHASTWREAFEAIVGDLLADASDWRVDLPVAPADLLRAVRSRGDALDAVRRPALLHFDLWDGNVLGTVDDAGRERLTGLVDGERYLYGDPLVDFVSPALMRRIEDEPDHPFLRGYADGTGAPVVLDAAARCRLALYRVHLYLLMIVEMPSRGMTGPAAEARRSRLDRLLAEELATLR